MSDYFDYSTDSGNRIPSGTRARAAKVNAIFDLISAAFDKFPDESTLNAYWDAISALGAGSGVLISANDVAVGYLNGKLVAGEGIDLTENNDGGDETLTISGEDASTSNKGIVELTTNAEAVTGTDALRAITAAALTARLAAPGAIGETTPSTIKLSSLGLKLVDLGGDNILKIRCNEDLTGDVILNLILGDGSRTLTLNENLTIGDGYDVSITAEDAAGAIVLDNCGLEVEDTTNSGNKVKLINANDDTDKSVTLHENLTVGAGNDGTVVFSKSGKTATVEDNALLSKQILQCLFQRPVFTYNGGATAYTIKVGAAFYTCKDKTCFWNSELTTGAIGAPDASTFYYLYLDYSAITSGTEITDSELIWSTTAPSWNGTYKAWMNGDDRCIFACLSNGAPDNIVEFIHDGDSLVSYVYDLIGYNMADVDTGGVEVDLSSYIPAFSKKILILPQIEVKTADQEVFGYWWNDEITNTNHKIMIGLERIGTDQKIYGSPTVVYTNSSQTLRIYLSPSGDHEMGFNTHGWYLPQGM